MKSKISFINRTMLQKNVKLYWPIWTLYTIVLLLNGPFSMWSRFKNAEFIYGKNWHKYMLDIISPAISMEADMIFIFVMALVTGMAMFSYLYNSRACNMIHWAHHQRSGKKPAGTHSHGLHDGAKYFP